MIQNVFIIGLGNVGNELIKQICLFDIKDLGIHLNPTNIIGIANSKYYYFNHSGITFQPCDIGSPDFNAQNILIEKGVPYRNHNVFLEVIKSSGLEGDVVFIDATSDNDDMIKFHLNVITKTRNKIVTCNKNPLSLSSFNDFLRLTQERKRYGIKATLMAGSHALDQLREYYDTCEKVERIEGCFSGTLGYISTELESGKIFSEIIKSAYNLGYTEPNPLDDLNGLDVARKLLIIARSLNINSSLDDIRVNPIINGEKYINKGIDYFFDHVKDEDNRFRLLVASAKSKKMVLRYVASLDLTKGTPNMMVSLVQVDDKSSLGMLKGTANKIVIRTNHFTENNEYIIQAPGAGVAVTASGIRRDLLQMLQNRTCNSYFK